MTPKSSLEIALDKAVAAVALVPTSLRALIRKWYRAPSTRLEIVVELGVAAAELVTETVWVEAELKSAEVEYSISYCVTAGVCPVSAVQDSETLSVSESASTNRSAATKF